MLTHARQVPSYRLPDVVERFFSRASLAVTPRQSRATRHHPFVLIRFEYDEQSQLGAALFRKSLSRSFIGVYAPGHRLCGAV